MLKLGQKCSIRCFCVTASTSFFPPSMWIELLCHLWSQLHLCGVFAVITNDAPQKQNKTKKSSQTTSGPMARYCFTQNRKQNHCPLVHHSQSENPPVLWWPGGSFSCSCVSQKGWLLSCEHLGFCEAESCTLDFCLKSEHWNSSALWMLVPRKISNLVPVNLLEPSHPYE